MNIFKNSISLVVLILASSSFAFAKSQAKITEIPVPAAHLEYFRQLSLQTQNVEPIESHDMSDWINLGKELWQLIASMGGTMKVESMKGVGVIPQAAGSMGNMTNWVAKQPKSYRLEIPGTVGKAFVFDYTVGFNYAGQFQRKGKFLGNVAILPFNVKCSWTWSCELEATVGEAVNVGSAQDPVAQLPITMIVNAKGKLNSKAAGVHFAVYGDGRLNQTVSEE